MAKATNPIPQGYHTVTPALTCRDAAKAIDFYRKRLERKSDADAFAGRQQSEPRGDQDWHVAPNMNLSWQNSGRLEHA
jgi:uncharacterized glyoxalase superfamily protein PhnB